MLPLRYDSTNYDGIEKNLFKNISTTENLTLVFSLELILQDRTFFHFTFPF